MIALAPALQTLLKSLPPRPDQDTLDKLVEKALQDSQKLTHTENRKVQWEYLLKKEIFDLAATEGTALKNEETSYYNNLKDKLDLALTFTEHEACEQVFPFVVLQDLLETQTITSCSHIFSWIEARSQRLTDGMVPQKGKALILLRTLNDLLRRLSKMGSTTIFCGRILTFLSGVFPLGERSGVNLRGEYGPKWEGVKELGKGEKSKAGKQEDDASRQDTEQMQVDGPKVELDAKKAATSRLGDTKEEKKEDFYNTFWSLQLPFSFPPIFAIQSAFSEFQASVNKVLPVVKEATAKERAMMGSRGTASGSNGLKRKREPDASDEQNFSEYFFAKFLTSPELLDLEIADTHFRRQFIFQLLILLHHLLTFTKTSKATWTSSRNRSLQMDFTLDTAEAQWVQETINKATEELRQTAPNGRAFAETVNVILEREKNWVKWKNELCAPFDKAPWSIKVDGSKLDLEGSTRDARKKMREDLPEWEWKLGTQPLTEIWEMGYRDLTDLQNHFQPGDVKDFVKKIKQEDARIDMRKKTLARTAAAKAKKSVPPPVQATVAEKDVAKSQDGSANDAAAQATRLPSDPPPNPASSPLHPSLPAKPVLSSPPKVSLADATLTTSTSPAPPAAAAVPPAPIPTPAPAPIALPAPPPVLNDPQITKLEESKQRWAWLALRTARDQYLQHFGKIGTGDILLLAEEIEKEKKEREKVQEALAAGNGDEIAGSPMAAVESEQGKPDIKAERGPATVAPEADTDVKMEDK